MAAYVLVHGAWHGGWCWEKVAAQLEGAGHTVAAPDLPGHGDDPTHVNDVTLQRYVDRVCEVLSGMPEPAVLVGHSMGGVVISQAAEQCPERVRTLVYLTAFLLPDGDAMRSAGARADESRGSSTARAGMQPSADGRSVVFEPTAAVAAFYHDCPPDDVERALARLVPQSLAPLTTPLAVTAERWGRVPRVYIECTEDRAITPDRQRAMYEALPCARVISMSTSHSPFFSAPEELARHLIEIGQA